MADTSFDVLIIGSGPGGYVTAIRAAQLGFKTAIVEKQYLGGICLNWGCIPTKALLRSAEIYRYMSHAKEYGLSAEKIGFDPMAVVKRSRGVANRLSTGVAFLMKKNKVDVIWGEAAIDAPGKVTVKASDSRLKTEPPKGALGPGSWRVRLRFLPFALRMLALALLVIAFARPQTSAKGENVFREGIDITIVLDISGSMLAEDFRPNRLEAAKKVGEDFILARESDRIGLVIFAGESFTQCPLTTDYQVLVELLHQVETGYLQDGTAIGEGIANAVNRMKSSTAKSKVMILLTDGVNNMGSIDPATAAEIARTFGIRVYTIGVGTRGMAPYPFKTVYGIQYQPVPVEIDEEMLRQVAEITGGQYFRATGNRKLEEIYAEIDALERTKIEVTEFHRYTELFYEYVFAGIVLLLTELVLSWFVFRKIP